MSTFGDTKLIPFEVSVMAGEVMTFWQAAHTLKLCNPETGLDFENYRLVIFHHDLMTDTTGENPKTVVRPCTVFGAMPLARYRELYLDENGKHKLNFKNTVPQLTDLVQYVCLFDFNYDRKDAMSFLNHKELTRKRILQYGRKTIGVENLLLFAFERRILNDFALKIVTTIFRLDFPTDADALSATQEVLGRFMKKE